MKILYIKTNYWFNLKAGGSVAHVSGFLNSLYNKVKELEIVTNEKLFEVNAPQKIISPVKFFFLPVHINELLYNIKLLKYVDISEYDIIYQRYSGASFIGAYVAKKRRKYFILEYNSSDLWKLKNWKIKESNIIKRLLKFIYHFFFLQVVYNITEKYNLRNASLIVVVSSELKKILIKKGIKEKKILVNPNGVDINKFSPIIKGGKIRKKFGINKKNIIIGFIGTFGQWHGVIEMAKAIVKFYEKYKNQNVKFLLIGEGPLLPEAKRIIFESQFKNNVIFTGLIPYKYAPDYLAACDIFLSPQIQNPDGTEFFGSPTKLFEYMAMGKPIIASAVGQIKEILTHNKTGYLVPPGDVDGLAEAIYTLVKSPRLRKKLGENARKLVMKKYTWVHHVEKIVNKIKYDLQCIKTR